MDADGVKAPKNVFPEIALALTATPIIVPNGFSNRASALSVLSIVLALNVRTIPFVAGVKTPRLAVKLMTTDS